jgi:hypothetical protein
MYHKITHFSSPKGILKLTNHNWELTQMQHFYGHSYSAPTPTINILQQIGLTITIAFVIHISYAQHRFLDHSVHTLEPGGFLGRVVDLALYKTKVLGLKPPPGGLSTNPRLTFVTFAPVSFHFATHKPILNLCTCFRAHGWGLIISPYKIGT